MARMSPYVSRIVGEPMRFMVRSRRPGVPVYLVDLQSYRGNGQCGCEHFTFRCEPRLVRGSVPSPANRCWHIEQARQVFLDDCLHGIRQHQQKTK